MLLKRFNPFSDNIVFVDTEYSTSDPYVGELLSIGIVKFNGDELYLEFEHEGPVSEKVKINILPKLINDKISRETAREKISNFIVEKSRTCCLIIVLMILFI